MNRLETYFGDQGQHDEPCRLKPYSARYRFEGRTFGLTIWAVDEPDATLHCRQFGLVFDGEIVDNIEL